MKSCSYFIVLLQLFAVKDAKGKHCCGPGVYYKERSRSAQSCCMSNPFDISLDINEDGSDGVNMECSIWSKNTHECCQNPYVNRSNYTYSEVIDDRTRKIVFGNCPNHRFTAGYSKTSTTTRRLGYVTNVSIPAYPQYDYSKSTVSMAAIGSDIGILFNGAWLYSPYGGSEYGSATEYSLSAIKQEGDSFDECGCHSTSDADSYHCHIAPSCLLRQLAPDGYTNTSAPSPQIGWSYDGFPVYGPRGPKGVLMKKCDYQTDPEYDGDTALCLDECNGLYYKWQGDTFVYRYYISGDYNDGLQCTNELQINFTGTANRDGVSALDNTATSTFFPFTPVCFRGCCPANVDCSFTYLPPCAGETDRIDGYDSGYIPEALYPDGLEINYDQNTKCNDYSDLTDDTTTSPTPLPTPLPTPVPSSLKDDDDEDSSDSTSKPKKGGVGVWTVLLAGTGVLALGGGFLIFSTKNTIVVKKHSSLPRATIELSPQQQHEERAML